MKEYSVRLELKFESATNSEVQKKVELFLKELPRMDGVSVTDHSIMDKTTKKLVQQDIKK